MAPADQGGLIEEAIAQNAVEGVEGVLESNLFAFLVSAAGVADGDLIDAPERFSGTLARNLGRYLRLETEAIGFQLDVVQHFAAEYFVARLHVRQVQISEHVGQRRQRLVGDVVPEIEHAMRLADETRTVNHVGAIFQNRLQKPRIFVGIVLQVGVLNENHVAGGFLEAASQSGAFALIGGLIKNADFTAFELSENAARVVRTAVIDNDDLFRNRNRLHTLNYFVDPAFFVVDGDDHGHFEAIRDRVNT